MTTNPPPEDDSMPTTFTFDLIKANRAAALAADSDKTARHYGELIAVARSHGMAYEVERLTRAMHEAEGEADHQRDEALRFGFDPDDESSFVVRPIVSNVTVDDSGRHVHGPLTVALHSLYTVHNELPDGHAGRWLAIEAEEAIVQLLVSLACHVPTED